MTQGTLRKASNQALQNRKNGVRGFPAYAAHQVAGGPGDSARHTRNNTASFHRLGVAGPKWQK